MTTTIAFALCAAWLVAGLVGHEPWKPDEAYSFGVVLQFLHHGDWVVPTLAGEPFLEKPPLMFVTAGAFATLFDGLLPLHDAARLASGFYMAWALVFLALTARELYGRGNGWPAVLVMLGCMGLVVRGHQLVTDIALVAGISTAIYGIACARRQWIMGGVCLGIGTSVAFLAKGLIGPGVIGLTVLGLFWLPEWRSAAYARAIALAAIVALPGLAIWPTALYLRSPAWFHEWLVANNFGRFLGSVPGSHNPPPFYLRTLLWHAFPALPIAVWACSSAWLERRRTWREPGLQLPTVVFVALLLVLMAAHDSRELYAMPALLPLALLAAARIDRLPHGVLRAWSLASVGLWGLTASAMWFGWIALPSGAPPVLHAALAPYESSLEAPPGSMALVAAIAATIAWCMLALPKAATARSVLMQWTAGFTLCWILAMTLWLPFIDTQKSYRAMIESLSESLPLQGCVTSRHLGEPQRAMLDYYLSVQTVREELQPGASCDALLVQGWRAGPAPVLEPVWVPVWEGARPGDQKELYRLYLRRPLVPDGSVVRQFPESGSLPGGQAQASSTLRAAATSREAAK